MAWFEGTHEQTVTLAVPADRAVAHFSDLATVAAQSSDVEEATVQPDPAGGGTIQLVLEAQDHGIVKFQGRYGCRYEVDGNTVRWSPEGEGNLKQTGSAVITATDDGCTVAYTETVAIDLDVNAMMAPMLKPMIGPVLAKEIREYLQRMVSQLEG